MIRIAGVEKESSIDGEGIRYVIFVQGCTHNCEGCQNPQTHSFTGGYDASIDEIINDIMMDPLLDGITLSGGDPFFQARKCTEIAKACKEKGLTVWAYTGFKFDEFLAFKNKDKHDKRITDDMLKLLEYIDVVVDGPFMLRERTLDTAFRGSLNQRLIDVKQSLITNSIVEYMITY